MGNFQILNSKLEFLGWNLEFPTLMYSEITSNKRKTFFLVALFSIIVISIGWVLGAQTGEEGGITGIAFAIIVATVMNLIGYYKGDSVALIASGAKPIEKIQNPDLYNTIENLSITAGLPTPKIYIVDDDSPNAFATGRDPDHASVAVTTGLLKMKLPGLKPGVSL